MNAKRRVARLKTLLAEIGLEPERIEMAQMSSAMAEQFVATVTGMHEQIAALGPNPLRRKKEVAS